MSASAIVPAEPSPCRRCGEPVPAGAGQCPGCGLFQPGNRASLVHGARAGRDLASTRDEVLTELEAALQHGPGLEPRYAHARVMAAGAIARARLLSDWLARRGLFDAKGRLRPQAEALAKAEAAALRWLESLGCTPASAGRLGLDLTRTQATSLASEIAAARRSRGGTS